MLKRLHVRNFTVFEEADFEFSPGLNVVVGTNGTGKSHVLKLGYVVLNCLGRRLQTIKPGPISEPLPFDFADLDERIIKIFRPSPAYPSRLIRREAKSQEAVINYVLDDEKTLRGHLIISPSRSIDSTPLTPSILAKLKDRFAPPVFIPAKETLTLSWMLSASRQFKLPMDETYLDLLAQLGGLALQNPEPAVATVISALIKILGGEVEEQNGSFFLVSPGKEYMEMNLLAEGLRKFGTLQRLLSIGSLTTKSTLYWDEPEANLNPTLLRQLAALLVQLAAQGFQIILATHSLFLLKEFHILAQQQPQAQVRYFGLSAAPGEVTRVATADNLELLPDIVALDAELAQSDRFLHVLNQEDAGV